MQTINKVLEEDQGKALHECSKLITPVVGCIKNADEDISELALDTALVMCKLLGSQLINEINIKGDLIKLCTILYCANEKPGPMVASEKILAIYSENGYAKDIGAAGKTQFIEKIISNCQDTNQKVQEAARELLGYL